MLILDWRAAASAGARSREFPLVALAAVTFPVSSTNTCTATCPDARICLAIGGYAGFGKVTARPFKTPALTERLLGGAGGDGIGVALGVGGRLGGGILGRVTLGVGVTELELLESEFVFAFSFGVAVDLGVGVGVLILLVLVFVLVFVLTLALALRFVLTLALALRFVFALALKLKFDSELPLRLAFKFVPIELKLALIILFSFESSELSRLKNK